MVWRLPLAGGAGRRALVAGGLSLLIAFAMAVLSEGSRAQKTQEKYNDKFNIAEPTAGVAMAVSADGKYVYVAGPHGVIVSDDYGKLGSWTQTVRLK